MSASENKKAKKRRTKKGGLPSQPPTNKLIEQETVEVSSDSESAVDATYNRLTTMIEEIKEDRSGNNQVLLGPNSYLRGDRCFLCRCDRTPCAKNEVEEELDLGDDDDDKTEEASSQLALWVCAECRKTVEEEERRAVAAAADIAHLRDEDLVELTEMAADGDMASSCQCQSCQERRQIEAEHELETQELQQCWMELRSIVRQVYKKSCTRERPPTPDDEEEKTMEEEAEAAAAMVTIPDVDKVKDLVDRLVSRDPHQLFQRLESQGREFVIEMKVRLLKQLTSGHNTPELARAFVALLLQEYTNLCGAARTLASVLHQLEQEHMKKFNLTWELHNKHLFQSVIYHDPDVQDSLPMLITQLRSDLGSQEVADDDCYAKILKRYLRFDDEMSVIAVVWRDCAQLLDSYNEEQAALKAKQKMLKDDWEFFKAQRKLLEEQVLKSKAGSISPHIFEQQFTETMRQILQGSKTGGGGEECQCPNCNRKRCSCDECTITHMITCGLISPDVADSSATAHHHHHHHHHQGMPPFPGQVMSRYSVNVTPPSMSSTNTSSGSSSPISVDPERLTLPFEDWPTNFDLPDEIPEEIGDEVTSESSESEGNNEEAPKEEEEDYDDDDEDDDEDDDDEDYDDEDDDEEDDDDDDDDDDDEEENDDDDATKIPDEVAQSGVLSLVTSSQMTSMVDNVGNAQPAVDTCACSHCSQAKMEQVRQLESQQFQQQQQREFRQLQASGMTNQCQCHACLQQSGHIVATTLPQHIPAAPQPGQLHLYPHIHGSNVHSLNTSTSTGGGGGLHGHMRPLLQPHLFKMHSQGQPKPKKQHSDFNLDLDSQEALQEHIYHAYGEWDNTYNMGKLVMGTAHKFGSGFSSDLLPPPPLINSPHFMTDPLMQQNMTSAGNVLAHGGLASSKVSLATSNASVMTSHHGEHSAEHIHTEACFKTVKSVSRTMLNSTGTVSGGQTKPKVNMNPTTTGNHQHVDHCFQHNPFLHTHHSSYSTSPQSSPPMVSASGGMAASHNRKSFFPELKQLRKDGLPPANGCARSNNLHTHSNNNPAAADALAANPNPGNPSHANNFPRRFFTDPKLPSAKDGLGAVTNGCQHQSMHLHGSSQASANTQAAVATNNNVSTGTSAPCNEPDCDGHHEDNDSIDDSCSEQSSSTSASNQKDGKYCDCCYCEFFGHSNPPTAPISRNYAEMRERLRLRLKKRRENMPDGGDYKESNDPEDDESNYGDKGLDELIKFINGDSNQSNNKLSAKAAKRARQKQRKAEERARQEAAERERLLQEEREREAAKAREAQAQKKKKKGKHKSNITNNNRNAEHTSNKISDKENLLKSSKEQGNTGGKLSVPSSERVSVKSIASKSSSNSKARSVDTFEASKSKPAPQPAQPSSAKELNKKLANSKVKTDSSQVNNKINGQVARSTKKETSSLPEAPGDSKKKVNTSNKKQPSPQIQQQSQVKPENKSEVMKMTKSVEIKSSEQAKPDGHAKKKQVQSLPTEKEAPQQPAAPREAKMNPALMRQKLAEHAKQLQIQHEKVLKHKLQQQQERKQKEEQMLLQQQQQQAQANKKKGKKTINPKENAKENHVLVPAANPPQVVNGTNSHCRATNRGHPEAVKVLEQPAKEVKQAESETKQVNTKLSTKTETSSKDETSPKETSGKNRRNRRKGKQVDDLDEIFMPRDLDCDIADIDEGEREVEEFKRFCMFSKPAGERVQVNVNMKDLLSKKKISCA